MEKQKYFYSHKSQVAKSIGLVDSKGVKAEPFAAKKKNILKLLKCGAIGSY